MKTVFLILSGAVWSALCFGYGWYRGFEPCLSRMDDQPDISCCKHNGHAGPHVDMADENQWLDGAK